MSHAWYIKFGSYARNVEGYIFDTIMVKESIELENLTIEEECVGIRLVNLPSTILAIGVIVPSRYSLHLQGYFLEE